jgi:uncharacterized protein YuzE
MAKFDYDELSDSLFVSIKKPTEKVDGSAEIGDIILDFTAEGKIISVEVRGISKVLRLMGFNSGILSQLTNVELIIQPKGNAVYTMIMLKTAKITQPLPLALIPVRKPIVLEH